MTDPDPAPLPWTQADSTRPVYDAAGKVVSFTENAPRIVLGMNTSRAAIILLDRMAETIAKATGPLASGTETAALIAQAKIAAELVKQARGK